MNGRWKIRFLLACGLFVAGAETRAEDACWAVTGAQIADGTGETLRRATVRVCGDRIAAVGNVPAKKGERVVDGRGLVLAPGFLDIHNHSTDGLLEDPLAESQISQGITTAVQGPDGDSPWPIAEYLAKLREKPPSLNVMTLVGHATVRELVMGKDYKRAATAEEIAQMAALVDQGMREGAVGFSSGLEYDVGSYSTTEELIALARASAARGGFYMTHIRDEADKSFEAFREAIRIGRETPIPVQISHIKLGTVGVWGQSRQAVALFRRARAEGLDVTADCYPYTAWHANIEVLVPDKQYDDPRSVEKALDDVGGAKNVTITACKTHPEYIGKDLEALAQTQAITSVELFSRIVRDGGADVIGHSMKPSDVETFYREPWVMVASDGGIGSSHPRGTGTFPRVLGRFARQRHLFSLPEAIRKMTSLPAKRLLLSDRGLVRASFKADLVLFDPKRVLDRSTFQDPAILSEGIRLVCVNGEVVWRDGKATGARPGRVLPDRTDPPR